MLMRFWAICALGLKPIILMKCSVPSSGILLPPCLPLLVFVLLATALKAPQAPQAPPQAPQAPPQAPQAPQFTMSPFPVPRVEAALS